MNRYWTLQVAGWMGYSAVGMTINLLNGVLLGPLLAGHAVLVPAGIGLTHLLRRELHRRRTPERSVGSQWPLLVGGTLAISVLLTGLVIGMNVSLAGGKWDSVEVAALWWGMFLAVGVWTILYVRFCDQRRNEILATAFREARLQVLEAQINPHFLFNALNSIRALVELDPPRAQDMLTRLSNVLRNGLRADDAHTVPLGAELAVVSDYLALEAVRFGDRLQSSIQAEGAAAACQIPPMMLQTLVENGVKHGIGQNKGPGELLIQAAVSEGVLQLVVENSGRLRDGRGGMGLKNVRERLQLIYGGRASLQLEEKGDRVRASIAIPVMI